jgi:thiamine biosynthesis lipoprotein
MNVTRRSETMGCSLETDVASDSEYAGLLALFAARDARFSRFLAASELSHLNRNAGVPCRLSAEFARMLQIALQAAEATDGLVDPTLGGALTAAGYDRDFARLADHPSPSPAGPAQPSRIGELRLAGQLLSLPVGMALDLNGVVKSLSVDEGLAACPSASFVACGGDLAVRAPTLISLPGGGSVLLRSGALATSGTAKRHWRRGGLAQHHLIDPVSGVPAPSPWQAVTVCGSSCLNADIAAKAAFLRGADGPDWLDLHQLPGRFLSQDSEVIVNRYWQIDVSG